MQSSHVEEGASLPDIPENRPAGEEPGGELVQMDPNNVVESDFRTANASAEEDRRWRKAIVNNFGLRAIAQPRFYWICLFTVMVGLAAATLFPAPGIAGIAGLILLGGVFIVAFGVLLSLARGFFPVGQNATAAPPEGMPVQARRLAFALLEQSLVPCLLTGREGNGIYVNDAYRAFFDVGDQDFVTLEQIFQEDEELRAGLYRLARSASLGERSSEDFLISGANVDLLGDRTLGNRWLRIEIRPADLDRNYYLWEVTDITDDKTLAEAELAISHVPTMGIKDLPIGAFIVGSEGDVSLVNDTLAEWLGHNTGAKIGLFDLLADPTVLSGSLPEDGMVEFVCDTGQDLALHVVKAKPSNAGLDASKQIYLVSQLPEIAQAVSVEPVDAGGELYSEGAIEQLTDFFDQAPIGIAIVDSNGALLNANRTFRTLSSVEALPGDPILTSIAPEDRPAVERLFEATLEGSGEGLPIDVHLAGDGEDQHVGQLFASRLDETVLPGEGQAAVIAYFVDTTDQRALEVQFAQSQKMQAVGQLAGGVAHDFNNVLTAIIGYCDLLLANHKVGDPSFADLNQIKQNANRAANLVRQLLAFSRRQTLVPRVLQLSNAIAETEMLLKRLLGEKIAFVQNQQRDLGLVKVDQGQMEQVVINLAVNARDAMRDGGTLTITTYNVSTKEAKALGHALMPPAEYVCLEISDTGHGIAKENLGKIFEPFYTTKGVGEGTGLGLSTVYGIVKQTGGFIFADSVVGEGTTFRIYLPRHADSELPEAMVAERTEPADLSGEGTVLLVEDEDAVRTFAARALTTRGYRVLEASNGEMGLEVISEMEGHIDIMVSDVVMPNMDGPTLAAEVRKRYPDIKIIFISGYAEEAFRDELDRPDDFVFLPKPFSLKQLALKVKEVLGG